MTDKEKNKIADILLDFYDEFHSNEINRPMIPSIYAGKILDSLKEELVSDTQSPVIFYGLTGSVGSSKEEPISKGLEETAKLHVIETRGDDVLARLEKQDNSPIKWNKNTKDCKPKVNHSVLMNTTHGIAEGEWQGEQWHQYRWSCKIKDSDVLYWTNLSELEKQGEQKPAWSEEDEKFFKTALWHISHSISNGKSTDIHCDTTDWFKSLKGRYTWRPSDEQINALAKNVEYVNVSCTQPILKGLLEDLKKLK